MSARVYPTSKPKILAAAVALAKEKGLRGFSRGDISKRTRIARATISYHFGSMDALRKEVVEHAIDKEVVAILADARTDRDSASLYTRMSAELKAKVAAYVTR